MCVCGDWKIIDFVACMGFIGIVYLFKCQYVHYPLRTVVLAKSLKGVFSGGLVHAVPFEIREIQENGGVSAIRQRRSLREIDMRHVAETKKRYRCSNLYVNSDGRVNFVS